MTTAPSPTTAAPRTTAAPAKVVAAATEQEGEEEGAVILVAAQGLGQGEHPQPMASSSLPKRTPGMAALSVNRRRPTPEMAVLSVNRRRPAPVNAAGLPLPGRRARNLT